jgi:hypothetical protein
MKCMGFVEITEHPHHRLLLRELARRSQCCPGCIITPVCTGMQMRRINFHTPLGHGSSAPQQTLGKSLPVPILLICKEITAERANNRSTEAHTRGCMA